MDDLAYFDDAGAWLEELRPRWSGREAEHDLLVGYGIAFRDRGVLGEATLAILAPGPAPRAAFFHTPRRGFVVAAWEPGAASDLVRAVRESGRAYEAPRVFGGKDAATEFARAWAGDRTRLGMAQRILATDRVTPPRDPPAGRFRAGTVADVTLVGQWLYDFTVEALPHAPITDRVEREAHARNRIAGGSLFLWETDDDGPVCVAGLARPTETGITLNSVYTPPEHRSRGYASALVAALTQHVLDRDRAFVCLHTDLSNPTSNAIYERLGYRYVCDNALWVFDA